MATLVNKMNREVKVIIPNMREFRVFYSDNEGSTMFFKRDWEEVKITKQEEQVWSEEDEEMLNSCISSIEESKENRYAYRENDGDTSYDREIAWLKSLTLNLKKKNEDIAKLCSNEWSEEDKKMYKMLSSMVHGTFVVETKETQDKLLSWFKARSSRPKTSDSWKPSEEQMEAIKHAYNSFPNDCPTKSNLMFLYRDLKKLM